MHLCRLFFGYTSSRQTKGHEDMESRRGELCSSLDYIGYKAGDNTSSYMLLFSLTHTDKRTFPFISFNFAQWRVITLLFSKPSVDVKACICAVWLNSLLPQFSNTLFKLHLQISIISPSNLAGIRSNEWVQICKGRFYHNSQGNRNISTLIGNRLCCIS